jgi:hypothetical protein
MTNEIPITNDEALKHHSSFGFRHSFVIGNSSFVIRHSFNQPDRHWIPIDFSLARLDRRNDH